MLPWLWNLFISTHAGYLSVWKGHLIVFFFLVYFLQRGCCFVTFYKFPAENIILYCWVLYSLLTSKYLVSVHHGSKFFVLKNVYLFIWLHWVLVATCGISFPDQGLNPGPLHWEPDVSHWATGAVPWREILKIVSSPTSREGGRGKKGDKSGGSPQMRMLL